MFQKSLLNKILLGEKVLNKLKTESSEYFRKVSLLMILAYFSFFALSFFAILSFMSGDFLVSAKNIIILILLISATVYLRMSGNIQTTTYIFLILFIIEFLSDFFHDTNRGMWSLVIPLLCFFMLGTKKGAIWSLIFLSISCFYMFFLAPEKFTYEFKIRFPIIFLTITIFSYLYEKFRFISQTSLEKSNLWLKIQRDIGIVLNREENINKVQEQILDLLLSFKEFDCGGVFKLDENTNLFNIVAFRGVKEEFIKNIEAQNFNELITNIQEPFQIFISNKIKNEIVIKEGIKSYVLMPIKIKEKIKITFIIGSHTFIEIPFELEKIIQNIVNIITHGIERISAIDELKKLTIRHNAILSAVPDIIIEVNKEKVYTWANKAGYEFFGDDVIGKEASYYFEGVQDTYEKVAPLFKGTKDLIYVESLQRRKDGEKRLLAWWCKNLTDEKGNIKGAISSARDITEIKKIEQQLRQAHKMEAVGQLAGGIAHDFNNQLTAISGFAELICQRLNNKNDKIYQYASNILMVVKRTSDLISKLLAFSRKGKFLLEPTDVHQLIEEIVNILSHTIDKRIKIIKQFDASPSVILCDSSQIQNALLNVAINARDAMPDGGQLTFKTERIFLDKNYSKRVHYEIEEGFYICISISDTGIGMDEETKKHLFEPFFTTKGLGKGTGMGLAAVYGIVKNHKGAINIYSELGHGTTCRIYLKAYDAIKEQNIQNNIIIDNIPKKSLRILLIDDEELLCEMAKEMLESYGYIVTAFSNVLDALEFYKKSFDAIDIVILDLIMPLKSGKETFFELKKINPFVKVIISSGYSSDGEAQTILNNGARGFIQKPFILTELIETIDKANS